MMIFQSIIGEVELTVERKKHILLYHPDFKPYFAKIKTTLLKPSDIRMSKSDSNVLLFYKYFANIMEGKYIAVVVKTNSRRFILTTYLTKHKLSGEKYEQK